MQLPTGFINSGNDCYINSVFQLLLNLPEYMNYLKSLKDQNGKLSILEKVVYIVNKQKKKDIRIMDMLKHVDPKEYDGTQKDACEFLFRILENFVDNNTASLSKQVYKRKCKGCKNKIYSESIQFPVYIEKYNLDKFIIPEPDYFIKHTKCDIEMKCEKCNYDVHSEKHGYRSKNLLILCIKRFNYDMTKDSSPIGNLLEFGKDKKLISVICHFGNTNSGHYFTLNYIDDKWFIMNDEKVEEISAENVVRCTENLGYILVFLL